MVQWSTCPTGEPEIHSLNLGQGILIFFLYHLLPSCRSGLPIQIHFGKKMTWENQSLIAMGSLLSWALEMSNFSYTYRLYFPFFKVTYLYLHSFAKVLKPFTRLQNRPHTRLLQVSQSAKMHKFLFWLVMQSGRSLLHLCEANNFRMPKLINSN